MTRSKYDIPFESYLDMTPKESVISPISLTKSRKLLQHVVYKINESMKVQFPAKNTEDSLEKELKYYHALFSVILRKN